MIKHKKNRRFVSAADLKLCRKKALILGGLTAKDHTGALHRHKKPAGYQARSPAGS